MSDQPAELLTELSPFAAKVIGWMDEHGVSGREMAKRCGLSPSYFTTLRTGKTGVPSASTIRALSREIGEDLYPYTDNQKRHDYKLNKALAIMSEAMEKSRRDEYLHGSPSNAENRLQETNVRPAPDAPLEALSAQLYLPLDVPVLGVSMGGDGHDFQFNGETVDYVRRPLGIAKAKRAYATYVVGESMVPAFREGAVLFVNPDKPPSIGDDVVIELHPEREGEPGPGYIKRLKKRSPSKIVVEQFNPAMDLEFDIADVKAIHRVVPWNELLGI